jgi:hypothetical protein
MVLQPVTPRPCPNVSYRSRPSALPAWVAVARRQKQCADSWWLVAQPDHAELSGDLAANFVSPRFPQVDPQMAKAISVHDSGWAIFPPEANPLSRPMMVDDGKPRSFIEFAPQDFLRAWKGSIQRAESVCAAGGVVVSRHFCALAQVRLKENMDDPAERQLILEFLAREAERQQRLSAESGISQRQSDDLLAVLQFCDLLSLYLCCGASEAVEFPQRFAAGPVRLERQAELYVLSPSPFQKDSGPLRTLSLGVAARKYPAEGEPATSALAFLVQ